MSKNKIYKVISYTAVDLHEKGTPTERKLDNTGRFISRENNR